MSISRPKFFSPLAQQKFKRFKQIRRGYWSAIILIALLFLSCFAELMINNRALIVKYDGAFYFPTYGAIYNGKKFGLDYEYEVNYRDLRLKFQQDNSDNWVMMPPVPYNEYENDLVEGEYPPHPPSWISQHYLGTDTSGRDVLARLVYGFRISIWFALLLTFFTYLIGVTIGCFIGYFGGWIDLAFQRIIEIWSNVPVLYIVMIMASIIVPGFWMLILILMAFGWMGMTWYMRTATYKEKEREYVMASRALGASTSRIIFRHILPNSLSIMITFLPFAVAGGIGSITSLDFLGFGLPPPIPSWGELISQGTENMESWWILGSVIVALVTVLVLITFVGEAIRDAFDPKKYTIYE